RTNRILPSFPTRRSSDLLIEDCRCQHREYRSDGAIGVYRVLDEVLQARHATREQLRLRAFVIPAVRSLCNRTVVARDVPGESKPDRKSTRLNSSHVSISY